MKFSIRMMLISVLGIGGILYTTIMNAEVSGYTDVHGCWGDCYLQYTEQYGTFSEQLEKRVATQQETPSRQRCKNICKL